MTFLQKVRDELAKNTSKQDRKRDYVKKLFLKSGLLSNPEKTYHLEFTLEETDAAKLTKILQGYSLSPKTTTRNGQAVVYLKGSDGIADVLTLMGAHKSTLNFEEIRLKKAIGNDVNRKVNFETANLNKTVGAAVEQINAIEYIQATKGMEFLSPPLEEVARLRLANDELTLTEIGNMLETPISKSGVNHRLRKICKIAESIKEHENDREMY
ncbi:MAG: DNA-binding protein WhiA [Defluviitaleaceae bacterium]|nr:DNA-binding protein WhiA [Defluviitaleaceae bacterium]